MSIRQRWIMQIIITAGLGLVYFSLYAWFRSYDVWDITENVPSFIMLCWSVFRVLFLVCMAIIFLTLGNISLRWFKSIHDLSAIEMMICYFFVGSSVFRIAMFIFGLQGFYRPIYVFVFSLLLLMISPFAFNIFSTFRRAPEVIQRNIAETIICSGLWILVAGVLTIVYFAHCQYSFDGDYLTHYGPYYNSVIHNGSLALNEVWYQYFYSKGAGLFYFSMLMTDQVGPLLVSFLFFIFTMLVIYAVIKRASTNSLWAIATVIFLLGAMAWPLEGFFIKHHCETAATMLSVVCAAVLMFSSEKNRLFFLFIATVSQASIFVLSIQAGCYSFVFIGLCACVAGCQKKYNLFLKYNFVLGVGGIVVIFLMLYNYSVTGLYEITPFRLFLQFWDQEIFSKTYSPYLMFYLSEGSSPDLGTIGVTGINHNLSSYYTLFRVNNIWSPTLGFILFSACVFYCIYSQRRFFKKLGKTILQMAQVGFFGISISKPVSKLKTDFFSSIYEWVNNTIQSVPLGVNEAVVIRRNMLNWLAPSSIAMIILVAAVYFLVRQPISILRASEFVSIYIIVLFFALIIAFTTHISQPTLFRVTWLLIPIILSIVSFSNTIEDSRRHQKVTTPLKFALGKLATNEIGPALPRYNKESAEIRFLTGKKERILSLNLDAKLGLLYLMYPGVATEVSYSLGGKWHEVVFGKPALAKKTLQDIGVNYFLVDLKSPMFGAIPFSPLFSGESLTKNFRVIWRSGSRYLLTWTNGKSRLGHRFLARWKKCLDLGSISTLGNEPYAKALYNRVLDIYNRNNHALVGIERPDDLKPVRGWQ